MKVPRHTDYVYPVESDDPPGVNQYAQFLLSDGYQTITLVFNSDRDNPESGVHKLGNLIDALTEFRNHLEIAVETRKVLRNLSRVKE